MIRKCAKVDVKPIIPIDIVTKTSAVLRSILLEVKNSKLLTVTNLAKFTKKLLTPETRDKISL